MTPPPGGTYGQKLAAHLAALHRAESLTRDPPPDLTCSAEPTRDAQRPQWDAVNTISGHKFGGGRKLWYEMTCRGCGATTTVIDNGDDSLKVVA